MNAHLAYYTGMCVCAVCQMKNKKIKKCGQYWSSLTSLNPALDPEDFMDDGEFNLLKLKEGLTNEVN